MTTANQAKEAVYQRFLDLFTGLADDKIAFDNDEFEEPNSEPWARLVVRMDTRLQETLGRVTNRRFRTTGTVFVQVYTVVNTGVKQGDTLAKEAADIFEAVSFSGLDFREANVRETGPDGKWYQHLVTAQFDYDEIK